MVDVGQPMETCELCGKTDLRFHFEIVHKASQEGMWIGSECIKRFDIGVTVDGKEVTGRAAHQAVDRDRAALIRQAEARSVINSLVVLSSLNPDFKELVEKFIGYYAQREKFTPKQMALLAWRFSEHGVPHNPRHFKVSLKRDREFDDLRAMEAWKADKLRPYLTRQQWDRLTAASNRR